jgi:hypothetical protein
VFLRVEEYVRGDYMNLDIIEAASVGGRIALTVFFLPIIAYNMARIIDPARTRRWEARYWHRFPAGTEIPESLDSELLVASKSRRIKERINAVIMLAFLALLFVSLKDWL